MREETHKAWPTRTEANVLRLLSNLGESYGLALVKSSSGELKRGTVYVLLGRMEDKGLVSSRQEDATPEYAGIPRRLYKLTGLGVRVLSAVEIADLAVAGAT